MTYLSRNGGAFGANKNADLYPRKRERSRLEPVGRCPACGGDLYPDGHGGAQCVNCGEVWDPWEMRNN